MAEHKQLLETWFQRVWNEGDISGIDDMFNPDTKAHGLGGQALAGRDGFKVFHKLMNSLVADINFTIDHSVSQGDWICTLCTMRGKCPNSGQDVSMTGTTYVRVEGDHIAEGYNHYDFMGLYEQLCLVPDGSFEKCLCGDKI
ncbi:MAG: ester cyclase [Robiginitomaculum sp.]|nr:ester cyclase [Robiginitomaculum sp.]